MSQLTRPATPAASPRARRACASTSRVRRLAGGVHQSLSNEIVETKHKNQKPLAGLVPQKAPQKNQTNPTMGHRSLTSPHTPSLFSSILLTAAALDPPGDSRRVSPRGRTPSTRPARVRRLAGGVHQSLSSGRSRTRSHRGQTKNRKKPRAPFLPQKAKKKPNKTIALSRVLRAPPMLYFCATFSPAGATSG